MKQKLIRKFESIDSNDFSDMLLIAAFNIEEAMYETGAEPGKDYTYKDLFELAMPFALALYRETDNATYSKPIASKR